MPSSIDSACTAVWSASVAPLFRRQIEAFEAAVGELDEVVHCLRMFGRPDYLLWIAVPDLDAYERFYMARLTDLPGVARTHSQFTMKTIKSTPGFPAPSR
ncbi:DNA-binding Lrp family transcriptional regulator [Streptomyces tendae]|uniref:Lrp/AsnC ligand binding domain-containing protein n=1 Tax=Streptomyces tendae TaxID=1932 RepID=UPI003836DE8A